MLEKIDPETYKAYLIQRNEREFASKLSETLDSYQCEILSPETLSRMRFDLAEIVQEAERRGFELILSGLTVNGRPIDLTTPPYRDSGWFSDRDDE
jgi:hypothetical protein